MKKPCPRCHGNKTIRIFTEYGWQTVTCYTCWGSGTVEEKEEPKKEAGRIYGKGKC